MLDKRPNFSLDEVNKLISELFNLNGTISSLPSERDQNFLVNTETNEKFVLKIANQNEKSENLELQNKIIIHLSNNISFNHPKLITKDKIYLFQYKKGPDKYFVRLLTYLEGIPFAQFSPCSEENLLEYGKFLGNLTKSMINFTEFTKEFSDREFHWDIKLADKIIYRHKPLIKETKKLQLINYFQNLFLAMKITIDQLPNSIIHNDANNYNVIVSWIDNKIKFGIIDFGDIVVSHTIINLAVGIAYAILDKVDPIFVISTIVRGYNDIIKLQEQEIKVLFTLIAIRLTVSVCLSAYQQTLEPKNSYLVISEKSAWLTLIQLKSLNPTWVELILRNTIGLPIYPPAMEIQDWLKNKVSQFHPLIVSIASEIELIDINIDSSVGFIDEFLNSDKLIKIIANRLFHTNKKIALVYNDKARADGVSSNQLFVSVDMLLYKNYISTIDIYTKEDLPIFLPFDGLLFKMLIDSNQHYSIIFEHEIEEGRKFYSLYKNIHVLDLQTSSSGSFILQGTQIGFIENIFTNKSPFQYQILCTDQLDLLQDSYLYRDKSVVDTLFFNPIHLFLGIFNSNMNENEEILNLEDKRKEIIGPSLSISYKKHLHIVRGYMQYLFSNEGVRYLDAVNNVPHVGHSNPVIVTALVNQAKLLNTNTRYLHETIIDFATKLTSILPEKLHVCFFVNSGSEANELALRLAETYTNKKGIAVLDHAYHGNTSKLIEISPYKHNGPGGKGTPDYVHILDLPDPYRGKYKGYTAETGIKYAIEAIEIVEKNPSIGTFIFESFPGVAGQIVLAKGFLKKVCTTIQKKGGVTIADEVQIGLGRVGSHFWGFQEHDIEPDIVTIGKPLGNGHPLGAVITTPEIANAFNNGMEYFNTFGGNPVSCAVGLAVLEEIDKKQLQKNALDVGTFLLKNLRQLQGVYSIIGDVRGAGLYIGIELVRNRATLEPADWEASYIIERMKDKGVLLSTDGPFHNVLKIKPPLVFTKENAQELTNKLERVLQESILKTL